MNTAAANPSTVRNQPRFTLERELTEDARLAVRLCGTADMHAIEPLDAYLTVVNAEALAKAVKTVEIDFRDLEFMNSSCFKCFVTWIGNVQDLEKNTRYEILFRSNRVMHWQRRSLNALRCFAVDLVTVQT